jgi:hypothetical protein
MGDIETPRGQSRTQSTPHAGNFHAGNMLERFLASLSSNFHARNVLNNANLNSNIHAGNFHAGLLSIHPKSHAGIFRMATFMQEIWAMQPTFTQAMSMHAGNFTAAESNFLARDGSNVENFHAGNSLLVIFMLESSDSCRRLGKTIELSRRMTRIFQNQWSAIVLEQPTGKHLLSSLDSYRDQNFVQSLVFFF